MRMTLTLAVVLSACVAPVDGRIGSYHFTLSGSDTETAPQMQTTTPTGVGTLAITAGAADVGYDITIAETDTNPCSLLGTLKEKDQETIDIAANQTCKFSFSGGTVTGTLTSGSATLTDQTMSLTMAYSFAGTIIGIN